MSRVRIYFFQQYQKIVLYCGILFILSELLKTRCNHNDQVCYAHGTLERLPIRQHMRRALHLAFQVEPERRAYSWLVRFWAIRSRNLARGTALTLRLPFSAGFPVFCRFYCAINSKLLLVNLPNVTNNRQQSKKEKEARMSNVFLMNS